MAFPTLNYSSFCYILHKAGEHKVESQSMTGFGRGQTSDAGYVAVAEIKSVNHRFRDIHFKMSPPCAPLEMQLRKMIEAAFKRGRFEVFLDIRGSSGEHLFDNINLQAVEAFLQKLAPALEKGGYQKQACVTDFLSPQFTRQEQTDQKRSQLAKHALKEAIGKLACARSSEGKKLVQAIKGHIDTYKEHLKSIEDSSGQFQELIEQKLRKKFEDISQEISIDRPRFMQETIYYMEKMDIQEEITRIKSHLEKLESIMKSKHEIGRQVDFLVQELNRETNTIGSKSSVTELSNCVIQMKVQLEKIREQGLNLE